MEIEPISPTSSTTDRWLELWRERLRGRPVAADQAAADGPPFTPIAAPRDEVVPADGLDTELAEHPETGAQMVRVVERDTGRVLSEIPHHQVLDLVARLLEQNHRPTEEGASRGGQH